MLSVDNRVGQGIVLERESTLKTEFLHKPGFQVLELLRLKRVPPKIRVGMGTVWGEGGS